MSKYEPLRQFLTASREKEIRLSVAEIERKLGFKLPDSAYRHEAWWSNNEIGHSHARAWLRAGWRTASVDLAGRKVTFTRAPSTAARKQGDPWACMAGTVTIHSSKDLTAPSEDWNAEKGLLLNE